MKPSPLISCLTAAFLTSCQTDHSGNDLLVPTGAGTNTPKVSAYQIPPGTGLEQLVFLSMSHHPSLLAARQKVTRLQARVAQEKALPDPNARVAVGDLAQTAAGQVDSIVGVEQRIPFPGKRKAKALAAQKEVEAAQAELEGLKLSLAERVRYSYWKYYLAQQNLRITRENREVLRAIEDIVKKRVETNQATQADLLRTINEISKIDAQIINARQQCQSAQASLNALLNRPAGSALPAPKRSSIPSNASLNELISRAESYHPSVRSSQARLDAFKHRLRKAKLEAYPDLMVGVQRAWVSDSGLSPVADGSDQTMFTLGINLPLWRAPRRAGIEEASAGIAEMQAIVASSRSELRQRVEDAWFRAKSSREMIKLFDQRLIPDARQAHELALKSYSAGEQSFVDVLDTWRMLLTLELQQESNRASLGNASAALKSAAGIE